MYGRQIGTLWIERNSEVVWSLSGSQDEDWLLASLVLSKGDYEVKFSNQFK